MSNTMLTLMSKDNQLFTVKKEVATQSITIKNLVKDDCQYGKISVLDVESKTLALVIEYLNKLFVVTHSKKQEVTNDLTNFFKNREMNELLDIGVAAIYLGIKELLDRCCEAIDAFAMDKSPEAVGEIINFVNNLTPEEVEAVRKENAWAFQ